jgi:hypothetical protein
MGPAHAQAAEEPAGTAGEKAGPMRTWTDQSGKFTREAALVECRDGMVLLRNKDGTTLRIPLEKLSEADRAFVKAHPVAKPAPAAPAPAAKAKVSAAGQALYERISAAYLDGHWDELATFLKGSPRQLAGLGADQRADIAAMRRVLAECRPEWWEMCKAGGQVGIHANLFGRPLDTVFDPAGKGGTRMSVANNRITTSVSWAVADMDNPEHAEHGFSKGELCNLNVWATLGLAATWTQIPPQALVNISEADKTRMLRYQDFCGNVTGLYYGMPRARRWGAFLYLLMWKDMYAQMPIRNSRKAVAAALLAEILADPAKYASLPLPTSVPAENCEEKLAEHYRDWIEKHSWTLAEDLALRRAIQSFAAANEQTAMRTQRAVLSNKLAVAFDPEADAALRPKRDAWLHARLEAALQTGNSPAKTK